MMDRVKKARARMLIKHPFFATLLMQMEMVEDPTCGTMWTDMERIGYDPKFVDSVNDDVLLFGMAHEVSHVAFEHGIRLNGRDPDVWNIAGDYVINPMLKDQGFTLWEHALYDAQWAKQSVDHVYNELMKKIDEQRKQQGGQGDPGKSGDMAKQMFPNGMHGDIRSGKHAEDPAQAAKTQRTIQRRVAQAATAAKMAGKFGGDLERLVDEILNPKVPWPLILRDYMTRAFHRDQECWSKRNRRFRNVYLPSHFSRRMGPMGMIGDTSGSITNKELCKYTGEGNSIAEDVKPEKLVMMWADTVVCSTQIFMPNEKFKPKPTSVTGGTDMRVPLKEMEKHNPQVVVLFTDGHTPWPKHEPDYPLIVCCTTDVHVPIGQVIRI